MIRHLLKMIELFRPTINVNCAVIYNKNEQILKYQDLLGESGSKSPDLEKQ